MSRILLAWELGGNFGHAATLSPLARALKAQGHEVALVVKDLATLSSFLNRSEALFLQAPQGTTAHRKRQPVSFGDILWDHGFSSPERLEGLARGWQGIFDLFRPDVVVAEYAPSAVFCAQLSSIPCLRMDTGFAIPPEVSPWPCFRPWLKLRREQLFEQEASMLQAANQVRNVYGKAAHAHLFEAVRADLTLLTTVPELDHYPGRKGGRYIGPLLNLGSGVEIDWSGDDGARVFAYLRPFPGLKTILEGLQQSGSRAIVVVPGIGKELVEQFSGGGLAISNQPALLRKILPEADLVISHAGHGLTSAALLAGVPTLAVPTQIEQLLLTKTMERLGIGVGLSRNDMGAGVAERIRQMTSDRSLQERVRRLTDKYRDYDEKKTIARLVRTIERLPKTMNIRRTQQA